MNTKLHPLSGELGTPEFQGAFNELVGIAQRGEHVKVYNGTGGTLAAGTLVRAAGYDADGQALSVAAADATAGQPALGVLSEAVANEGYGIAYRCGVVTGLNTSAFSAVGSLVYLGAAGAIGTTAPVTTGHIVQAVGVVTVKHATAGAVWFDVGAWRMIGDIPTGTVIGSATLANIRGGKITLNGVNPTRVLFQDADAATILGTEAETFVLADGDTLIVDPDSDGDDTVTFAATAGTSVSGETPSTDISGETDTKFMISVDGEDAQEVTLALTGLTSGGAIANEMQNKIQDLGGVFAAVTVAFEDGVYTITSGTAGTGSSVVITDAPAGNIAEELKIGAANDGVETAGSGDAANIAAATAAEVAAAIAAKATGWTATAEGNKVRITSESTGKDSSLVVNAGSTADTVLGIAGSAYGAQGLGYDSDMADDQYLVQATLNGVGQANLAAKCLGITSRTAAGFSVECETAAAAHDVDLVIVGVEA
jgi:hypothetical protein